MVLIQSSPLDAPNIRAGYVPLSALTPLLAPEHRGEALSLLSLGASAAMLPGPGIVACSLARLAIVGVIWIFAGMCALSGVLALTLTMERSPTA